VLVPVERVPQGPRLGVRERALLGAQLFQVMLVGTLVDVLTREVEETPRGPQGACDFLVEDRAGLGHPPFIRVRG